MYKDSYTHTHKYTYMYIHKSFISIDTSLYTYVDTFSLINMYRYIYRCMYRCTCTFIDI